MNEIRPRTEQKFFSIPFVVGLAKFFFFIFIRRLNDGSRAVTTRTRRV